jgi:hypothetical protein
MTSHMPTEGSEIYEKHALTAKMTTRPSLRNPHRRIRNLRFGNVPDPHHLPEGLADVRPRSETQCALTKSSCIAAHPAAMPGMYPLYPDMVPQQRLLFATRHPGSSASSISAETSGEFGTNQVGGPIEALLSARYAGEFRK